MYVKGERRSNCERGNVLETFFTPTACKRDNTCGFTRITELVISICKFNVTIQYF